MTDPKVLKGEKHWPQQSINCMKCYTQLEEWRRKSHFVQSISIKQLKIIVCGFDYAGVPEDCHLSGVDLKGFIQVSHCSCKLSGVQHHLRSHPGTSYWLMEIKACLHSWRPTKLPHFIAAHHLTNCETPREIHEKQVTYKQSCFVDPVQEPC